jgi:hypothetical protein
MHLIHPIINLAASVSAARQNATDVTARRPATHMESKEVKKKRRGKYIKQK